MNEKLKIICKTMEQQAWDTVLITNPKHIYYLTGYASDPHERFLGLVIPSGEEPFLIVPALDAESASSSSHVSRIITHQDTDQPYEVLSRHIHGKVGTLALEKGHLTVSRFEQLQHFLQFQQCEDIGPILQRMRVCKSSSEVAVLKQAVQLVEQVLRDGLKSVKPGVQEVELVAELEYLMKKAGAQGPSFDTMVLTGTQTALPHGVPGSRRVREGDLLMFDLGVFYGGYASDITRTFAVGGIPPKAKHIYEAVLAGNEAAISAVRPGVTYGCIDRAARTVIEQAGYGPAFLHRLGHGLGLDVHEYPSVHGLNEDLIQAGAVFTIEPGIYIPGTGGVRIEDDVLVTEEGALVLTTFPKQLTVIG
ncbi:M24 family metallopeptidase [Paenibacillus lemnae]|uniref:Aminopeptidase P family protein n=1 Tax=Paenibacillus lemnae TaxID=1330551 RepID=A0A848M7C3_PAELE|nr:Xaa-Pro peptidase family protein [Paenibacillus lemnae]NMO96111.1 aminopeptidase P family protein [Paenibacillus lemnae]